MQLGPQELQRLATLACLLAARLLPLGLLLPWLAPRRASLTWRVACTLALTLALLPLTAAGVREGTGPVALLPALGLGLVPHVAAELLRGGVLAFAFALPLYAFDWAGELAELVRAPSAVLPDDHDAGPLRQLQYAAALAIFFASGSHRPVLAALAATLQDQPLGALPALDSLGSVLLGSAQLAGRALALAVSLALPLLICMLLAALLLGLLGRAAALITPASPAVWSLAVLCVASLVAARVLPALPPATRVFLLHAQRLLRMLG